MACKVFSYSTKPLDFEIGGRNQNTQASLKACVGVVDVWGFSVREVLEGLDPRSLTCFSRVGVFPDPTTLPKSSAPPGVLGVFADPKEANAPEPRPNALDAPVVGDAKEVVEGDMAPKGFLLLWEELSPWRLPNVKFRVGWSVEKGPPLVEGTPVDSESLLVLLKIHSLVLRVTIYNRQ